MHHTDTVAHEWRIHAVLTTEEAERILECEVAARLDVEGEPYTGAVE